MASYTISPIWGAGAQLFDNNGNPLAGGKIYTYIAGTTTPATTYTTPIGSVANSNPIIANSAGRLTNEIWFPVSGAYKFVLKNADDVLLATYDNIPTIAQPPVVNDASSVYYEPGYEVTAGNFTIGTTYLITFIGTTDFVAIGAAANLTGIHFTATGIGSGTGKAEYSRTVQSKLRESISPKDFGAVGDGVTDDTDTLRTTFDYAIPNSIPVQLEGNYLISGPIQPYATTTGNLYIVVNGKVTITVDAAATGFSDVLYFQTAAYNSASISGGILEIDGANKAGRGITIRHDDAGTGGEVSISAQLKLKNFKETDAAATRENQALSVYGLYNKVVIEQPYVNSVQRTNVTAGACEGISVGNCAGDIEINQPYVQDVLVPDITNPSSTDADGIAVFGKTAVGTYNTKIGKAVINQPYFVNCQGRSFKGQIESAIINNPRVKRTGDIVTIAQGNDFDFQLSQIAVLNNPTFEYYDVGGTSPLGSSFNPVVFQQTLDDRTMSAKCFNGTVISTVLIPRFCLVVTQSTARESEAYIDNVTFVPYGSISTTLIDRAIIEVNMAHVIAKSYRTKLSVNNVSGPLYCYGIGYTSYVSGSLATKLNVEITNCKNTLSTTSRRIPIGQLSGGTVIDPQTFNVQNNYGFRNAFLTTGFTFDFAKLIPGCSFVVDIATVSATNPPGWGASGYALIEALQDWTAYPYSCVRVTKDAANAANTVFYTNDGGTTWGTIK